MKENIINIYKDVAEKKDFIAFAAEEIGVGQSSMHKYLTNNYNPPSIEQKEERLHTLIVNWRRKELDQSKQLLEQNT